MAMRVDNSTATTAGQSAAPSGEVQSRDRPVRRRRGWRRRLADGAVLFGLAGIAVTQPLLDLFGNNPTFFVAGDYGRRQIVLFVLAVTIVPAAAVYLVTGVAGLAGGRAAAIAHGVGVALLAGAFGLVLCRTVGVDATTAAVGLAVAGGVAVAVAEARLPAARRFLAYLALGNLAFVGLFGLSSPSSELLAGASYADAGAVTVPSLAGPVTVVVLDEFPLVALLRSDGTINEARYPNLAALAGETTWFRNASAEVATTYLSVPEILSGVRSDPDDLPTYSDHPRNLFTIFGTRYPINEYEVVTDLCAPDTCTRPQGQPLSRALSDATIVYRHRILPESLREGLPPVDQGWGSFGGDIDVEVDEAPSSADETTRMTTPSGEPDPMARMDEVPESESGRVGQAGALMRRTRLISATPAVNFIHVLLPHHPYQLTPWGVSSTNAWVPRAMPDPGDPDYERAFAELYAMQAMQIGAVDQMVGEIVTHLKATGAWDHGTFVLVSDHGIETRAPNFSRTPRPENEDGLLRIPLFVKAPGQTTGETRDEPATTLDVLPSLIDILGVETEWEMDGHSLFDGSEPGYDRVLTSDDFYDAVSYAEEQKAILPLGEGDGWNDVVGIGEQGDLVGTSVSDHALGPPSELSWSFEQADLLADPTIADGQVPVQLRGRLTGSDHVPPDLVVALDGVIAGTIGGYARDGDAWTFTGLLGPEVAGGADEVMAFEVERSGRVVTLRPLVP